MKTVSIITATLILLTTLIPVAVAAPTIKQLNESTYTTTASDQIVMECSFGGVQSSLYDGFQRITITSPAGNQMTFTASANSLCNAVVPFPHATCPNGPVPDTLVTHRAYSVYSLSGANTAGNNAYTVSGELVGEPGDGTWTYSIGGGVDFGGNGVYYTCLYVGGKELEVQANILNGASCLWNHHLAGATTLAMGGCSPLEPEQDYNQAVFFNDVAGGNDDPNPHPFTLDGTEVTGQEASLTGAFLAGANQVENTHTYFVWVDGTTPATDQDLRNNPGAQSTTPIDQGPPSTLFGPDEGVYVQRAPLNPAIGMSYQAVARSGTLGPEQLGAVLYVNPSEQTVSPIAFTSTETSVTCPNTATIRGIWTQSGNSEVFATFYHVQGNVADTDLRDNVAVGSTGYVSKGTATQGTHSAQIGYNNAVGNSFQLAVKYAGGEEHLGQVQYVAPFQCTLPGPTLTGFSFNPDAVALIVSQAQCNGDATEFSVNHAVSQTLNDLDVFIINDFNGITVMQVDDSEMRHIPSGGTGQGVFFFNRTLPPGVWQAVVRSDFGGLGALDYFYGHAFNVPVGTCINALVSIDELTEIVNNLGDTITFINNTFLNETEAQQTLNATQAPIANAILVFFWLAVLALAYYIATSHRTPAGRWVAITLFVFSVIAGLYIFEGYPTTFLTIIVVAGGVGFLWAASLDDKQENRQQ